MRKSPHARNVSPRSLADKPTGHVVDGGGAYTRRMDPELTTLGPAEVLTQAQLRLLLPGLEVSFQDGSFTQELDAIASRGTGDYVDFDELPAP